MVVRGQTARQRWLLTARLNQLPPAGDWFVWLILAGRGFGKTRTGAETIAEWARNTPRGRFALVAQTIADARDTMVEGQSGLLNVLDERELRGGSIDTAWNRSMGELYLKNGAKFKCFSSEKARSLRGPQHHGAWGDEPATWNDADQGTAEDTTWTNLLFGLRLGNDPRVILTGTPRPVRLIREVKKDEGTVVTGGSTSENISNLAETFKRNVIRKYEGTRLGRQELEGELLEDTPGALWKYAMFNREGFRIKLEDLPTLVRIVVAVDPQASQGSDNAETGIIVAGKDAAGRGYVLDDLSGDYSPTEWAEKAIEAYKYWKADCVVAERNNGGDMVANTIRAVNPKINVKAVWASRGKHTRAEPVSALYQKANIHHAKLFPDLEGQMTTWVPGDKVSPDRMDALVWAFTELLLEEEAVIPKTTISVPGADWRTVNRAGTLRIPGRG
ncbi:terminase large subunit domain-containing protein [Deinococcus sp. QL22]|uniref:terminase large subunit domain-containing protein n=1 Tax=Deinococcus sp. QL22 TaxID=2939437 RepID=UPI002016AD02|nr:terminase family protein [Deinococcus sp. QL22]UQN06773.1 terminase family protein [Deinococcus sp. QL22]